MPGRPATRSGEAGRPLGVPPGEAGEPTTESAPQGADAAARPAQAAAAGAEPQPYGAAAYRGLAQSRLGTSTPTNGTAAVQPASRDGGTRDDASQALLASLVESVKGLTDRMATLEGSSRSAGGRDHAA